MREIILILCLGGGIILMSFLSLRKSDANEVPYPEDYRRWTHIKSKIVGEKSKGFQINGGLNHTYGNELAVEGFLTGEFPEGSAIVFDVRITQEDSSDFSVNEVRRKRIDVMIKDSIKYKATGGWGYGQFINDSKTNRIITLEEAQRCYNCHSSSKNYVFGKFRE
jgi:hypothetical protein